MSRAESRRGGLLASEVRLVFTRPRAVALLGVLAAVPVVLALAARFASPSLPGDGPPLLDRVTENGLFVGVTSVLLCLPLLLPVAVSVVAGDAVAGEASSGTLRYLLLAPVGRARLLIVKLLVCLMWATVAVAVPALVGVVVGRVVFGAGSAPLLSGDSVGAGEAMLRLVLVVAYVSVAMWGLVGVGLAASTFTDAPLAAGATATVLAVVSQILAQVPQLDRLHPWLFTATWFDVGDLLRTPMHPQSFTHHAVLQAAWLAVLVPVAWARLTTRDVTT